VDERAIWQAGEAPSLAHGLASLRKVGLPEAAAMVRRARRGTCWPLAIPPARPGYYFLNA